MRVLWHCNRPLLNIKRRTLGKLKCGLISSRLTIYHPLESNEELHLQESVSARNRTGCVTPNFIQHGYPKSPSSESGWSIRDRSTDTVTVTHTLWPRTQDLPPNRQNKLSCSCSCSLSSEKGKKNCLLVCIASLLATNFRSYRDVVPAAK